MPFISMYQIDTNRVRFNYYSLKTNLFLTKYYSPIIVLLNLWHPCVLQQVTYPMIVRCMLVLWLVALALTSMPMMGFGVYYKGERCVRYREATEPADIAYAYVWFVFGEYRTLLRSINPWTCLDYRIAI